MDCKRTSIDGYPDVTRKYTGCTAVLTSFGTGPFKKWRVMTIVSPTTANNTAPIDSAHQLVNAKISFCIPDERNK